MYKPTIWHDHIEGLQDGTDMSAANFNNLEIGAMEANALAALNAAERRYCSDIAKNNEIVLVFEDSFSMLDYQGSERYIALPENAIRNTTNYNVFWQVYNQHDISGADCVKVYSISVTQQQANGFTFKYTSEAPGFSVRFYISGGMI